jgi:hypothetical protein
LDFGRGPSRQRREAIIIGLDKEAIREDRFIVEGKPWLDRQNSGVCVEQKLRWGSAKESVTDFVGGIGVGGKNSAYDRSAGIVLRDTH